MFAPNLERYLRLQSFRPAVRTWIRIWLDGLHDGTHVHWQLSPLSVLSLGGLWPFLKPLTTWPYHLEAIISMASRRRALNRHFGTMPSSKDESLWSTFFDAQPSHTDEMLRKITDWHRQWIVSGDTSPASLETLWLEMNELAAILMWRGYSTDDLFNRVKDGVIDPGESQGGTAEQRLDGFFDYFAKPEPRTYWVWTSVLSDTPLSRSQLSSFSHIRLDDPWQLKEENADGEKEELGTKKGESGSNVARVLLKRDERLTPIIISKLDGTAAVKERHRTEALKELKSLMKASKKLGKLSLSAETQMVLSNDVARKPWRYSRKRYALPMLGPHVPDTGVGSVGAVAQELFDSPGAVILEVFSEFENLGTKEWWTTSRDYHRCLRKDLGFSVQAFRKRIGGIFKKFPPADTPPAARVVGDVEGIRDFSELATTIRAIAPTEEDALLRRLDEITAWPHFDPDFPPNRHAYNTVHEISDLLSLARGFRNALTHKHPIPFHLHSIAVYLGAVLLQTYSSHVRSTWGPT